MLSFRCLFQIRSQRIELFLPENPVALDPRRRFLHGLRGNAAPVHAAFDGTLQKSRRFQNPQMFGNRGQGHGERRSEFRNRGFSQREAGEDGASRRIRESAKRGVQVLHAGDGIVNHMV